MQYVKVFRHGNTLYDIYRDENNEKKFKKFSEFECELFMQSEEQTSEFIDIVDKTPLKRIKLKSFKEYKETVEKFKDVLKLYGTQKPENQYRRYTYFGSDTKEIIKVCYFDIETAFNGSFLNDDNQIVKGVGGFPKPQDANAPITSIDLCMDGVHVCLSLKEYTGKSDFNLKYKQCKDEKHLLETFCKVMCTWQPDILTGWNVEQFDFPFIINRMRKLEIDLKLIDPFGMIQEDKFGVVKPKSYYWLDMLDLYKKFTFEPRESYSLQAIGEAEIGEGKIDYHEAENGGTLEDIYNNNFNLFIDYNVKDVDLLIQIDNKINLMKLVVAMSYLYNVNFDDVMGTTAPWSQLVYCETRKNNKILPDKSYSKSEDMTFDGGYVLSNPGYFKWVVSFDYASLYPSIIQAFNLCPSTYIKETKLPQELKELRRKFGIEHSVAGIDRQLNHTKEEKEEMNSILKKHNVSMTCSGHFFSNEEQGVSGYMMSKIYKERKEAKKKKLHYERLLYDKQYSNEEEKFELKSNISKYENRQMALKIAINSFFGACGNAYYILNSLAVAESITSCGRFYDKKSAHEVSKVLENKFDYSNSATVACDTDSAYFHLEPVIKKSGLTDVWDCTYYIRDKIIPVIDNIIKKNVLDDIAFSRNTYDSSVMDMKREAIAECGIYVGKKNYALLLRDNEGTEYKEGKKKIIGLNIKKTNLPKFIREKMLVFLDLLFKDSKDSEQKFQMAIKEFKEEFFTLDYSNISFPRSVNLITDKNREGVKALGNGKYLYTLETNGCPQHVRAALTYNKYITENNLLSKYDLISHGDKIKYITLNTPNKAFNQKVIAYPNDKKHSSFLQEEKLDLYVNYIELWEGNVIMPLEPLLKERKWSFTKTNKLSAFF